MYLNTQFRRSASSLFWSIFIFLSQNFARFNRVHRCNAFTHFSWIFLFFIIRWACAGPSTTRNESNRRSDDYGRDIPCTPTHREGREYVWMNRPVPDVFTGFFCVFSGEENYSIFSLSLCVPLFSTWRFADKRISEKSLATG